MKKTEDRIYLFESMPVKQAVMKQIIPAIASQIVILVYNLADTYFVGMLNDPAQTAAVTIAANICVLMTAIANLFAIGGASRIAQSLGKHDSEGAGQIASIAFWFCVAASCGFSILFGLLSTPILNLCGATEETFAYTLSYTRWAVLIGSPVTILNILLANLIRAEGKAFTASFGVSLGSIINIFLDPFFVLPQFLNLGAEGAGMATALSNGISTVYLLGSILLNRRTSVLNLHPSGLRHTRKHIRDIVRIGFPSSAQYLLTCVAVSALASFVAAYETEAVAALGIVRKWDLLPLYFSIGTANGILPLLAYNYSSGNHRRRHEVYMFGVCIAVGFSLLCVLIYEIMAPQLIALFIDDAATIAYGTRFLRTMVLAMPMMSVCYTMITQFQAMGRARESLICSVLRKGVLDIPLLFILDALLPLYGCVMVQPIVDTTSMIFAVYFYRKIIKQLEKESSNHEEISKPV